METERKLNNRLKIVHKTCEYCHGLGCNMCYMGSYTLLVFNNRAISI
jgi:hypothetical protein